METFGIVDSPYINESPEADAYAVGYREAVDFDVMKDRVTLSLYGSKDIVRLALAKTADEENDIAASIEAPVELAPSSQCFSAFSEFG